MSGFAIPSSRDGSPDAGGATAAAGPRGGALDGAEVDAAAPMIPKQRRRPALSPSRAADFKQCPLLYRFRAVDRLPEVPSPAQLCGTVVHTVLERLFALPAHERRPERARALWAAVRRAAPTGDFRPRPGAGCRWCPHQSRCPAFGGTAPAYPGWPADLETDDPPPGPGPAPVVRAGAVSPEGAA